MMKKGENVIIAADDDDEMRISVTQKYVTATPFTEEFFLRTVYYTVYSSPLI
jgi:hypothetical protein